MNREIMIYDDIGPDWAGMVSAMKIKRELEALGPGDVSLRINSYGGSVDEALAMIEILGRHSGKVTVTVDSIAASAASLFPVVFESTAASHARIMIHDPWTFAFGNAAVMRKTADVLDTYRDSILTIYKQGMKYEEEEIKKMLNDETWFTAQQALDAGLIGGITEPKEKVAAKAAPLNRFRHVPGDLPTSVESKATELTPNRIAASLAILRRKLEARKK